MSTLRVSRPGSDEAAAYYQTYIAEVGGDNIGEQLVEQLSQAERLFSSLDDAGALARYAPGKWSIKELLGHLNDSERIFSYRLLRISRGDATPLPGFDQDPYVMAGRFDERPLTDLLGEFRAIRLSTVALASGVPPRAWGSEGRPARTQSRPGRCSTSSSDTWRIISGFARSLWAGLAQGNQCREPMRRLLGEAFVVPGPGELSRARAECWLRDRCNQESSPAVFCGIHARRRRGGHRALHPRRSDLSRAIRRDLRA